MSNPPVSPGSVKVNCEEAWDDNCCLSVPDFLSCTSVTCSSAVDNCGRNKLFCEHYYHI